MPRLLTPPPPRRARRGSPAATPPRSAREAHYERATALLAEGDAERAIVEFRNVFRLDGNNHAARLEYANLLVARGELEEAIGQFLRLVEQDWANVAGHKRLAELALEIEDLPTAETHAGRAYELDPARPRDPGAQGRRRLPQRRERGGGGDGAPACWRRPPAT